MGQSKTSLFRKEQNIHKQIAMSKFYQGVIILLLAIVAILWFTRGCKKQDDPDTSLQLRLSQMQVIDKLRADSIKHYKMVADSNYKRSVLNDSLRKAADSKVKSYNKKIQELSGNVVVAKQDKDTAKYYNNCDSLASMSSYWEGSYNDYVNFAEKTIREKDSTISANGIVIGIQDRRINSAEESIRLLDSAKTVKAKTKVFAGPELFAQQKGLFGVGAGAILLNKKDQEFRMNLGITTDGKPYGSVGFYPKISFHK
jgi:hypothetical protein